MRHKCCIAVTTLLLVGLAVIGVFAMYQRRMLRESNRRNLCAPINAACGNAKVELLVLGLLRNDKKNEAISILEAELQKKRTILNFFREAPFLVPITERRIQDILPLLEECFP